jgi:hypothetical protein
MAEEVNPLLLNPLLRLQPWRVGDPFVILEALLSQVENNQAKQITAMYLDSVAATLEANLKFVQGVRSVIASAANK